MPIKKHHRQYDLVVLGATGYTGRWLAERIFKELPTQLRWALAGRSEQKLRAVADACKELNPDRSQPEIEIADSLDELQLQTLAKKTFVLITTVGPYLRYGKPCFKACAETGTHYLDCTGEYPWVNRMIQKYESTAKKTGAIMFPQIGVDSAPPDLCTWAMARLLRKQMDAQVDEAVICVHKLQTLPSGGTLATVFNMFDQLSLRELAAAGKPFALSPIAHTQQARPAKSLAQMLLGVHTVPHLGLVTTSINATTDVPIVERSWGLFAEIPTRKDQFYGPKFKFLECQKPASWLQGVFIHWFLAIGMLVISSLSPLRSLIKKLVYQPGEGQDREPSLKNEVEYRGIATPNTARPSKHRASVRACFAGGPYILTAVILAQGALTLLEDDVALDGGIYTPACLGQNLIDRLSYCGFSIEVDMLRNQ